MKRSKPMQNSPGAPRLTAYAAATAAPARMQRLIGRLRGLSWHCVLLGLLLVLSNGMAAQPGEGSGGMTRNQSRGAARPDDASREALVSGLRAWAAQQAGLPAQRIRVAPLDGRLRVVACPAGMQFDYPFAARDLVRARCVTPAWEVYVRIEVRAAPLQLYAARALRSGQVLEAADVETRIADAESPGALQDQGQAVGRMLAHPLVAGALLRQMDLQEVTQVLRLTRALRADSVLSADSYRSEVLARNLVPAGAAATGDPGEGARLVRDLPAGHILQASDIASGRRLLVARANLAAGRRVDAADFELRLVNPRDPGQQHFADYSGLENMELGRYLRSGELLSATDLRPALLVQRGQPVVLTVATATGMAVTVRVEALQDGRMGEQIRLRNPESGRLLSGVVSGAGAVRGL